MAKLPYNKQVKINTPHAAVLLWNYKDRIEPNGVSSIADLNAIDEIVISTLSLISVGTNKSKGQPAGTFQFVLAPTKNWVKTITPGSWFVVLMSADTRIQRKHFLHANAKMVKFFGRVDEVAMNVNVDQESGARMTTYTVSGQDWGQIFNSILYVDPVARETTESAISTAGRFIYDQYLEDATYAKNMPTSTTSVKKLIELWGTTAEAFATIEEVTSPNTTVIVRPETSFSVPSRVQQFFNFTDANGKPTSKLTQVVAGNLRLGKLKAYDKYQSETEANESIGIINIDTIFGTHTFWQVLQDNCSFVINELVTDMRWEDSNGAPGINAKPHLTLYKRIRPFAVRSTTEIYRNTTPGDVDGDGKPAVPDHKIVDPVISRFENIRRITIPKENVISITAGTNWADKYNYAEIQVDHTLLDDATDTIVKINASIYDTKVFGREGFKPMIAQTKYLPAIAFSEEFNPLVVYNWKYILKEWYFDTHNMLNGTINFVGIDTYIQVGDNILVDADVLGITNNMNTANTKHKGTSYMLAHVEGVSHTFQVDQESGARSYSMSVQFVRGIITDANGKQFLVGKRLHGTGRLDINAATDKHDEPNSVNVFSTSSSMDPDHKVNGT